MQSSFISLRPFLTIIILAILLRVLIMPFFFHSDLKVQYYHSSFLQQGVFNIYDYVKYHKKDLPNTETYNYPPLAYFTLGVWEMMIRPVVSDEFTKWMKNWNEDWFTSAELFRYLFILKIPYLFFDLLTGILLLTFVKPTLRKRLLILWYFNPISLYIIYALGTFDIIPTFLLLLALYLYRKDNMFGSGAVLALGSLVKLFPLLFLPFFVLPLLFKNKKKAIWFSFGTLLVILSPLALLYKEFLMTADSGILTKVTFWKLNIMNLQIPVFYIGIFAIVLWTLFQKMGWRTIAYAIIFTLLIVCSISNFHPQYFLWSLPFIVIFLVENPRLLIAVVPMFFVYILHVIVFQDRYLTLGIFSPVLPEIYDVGYLERTIFSKIDHSKVLLISQILFGIVSLLFLGILLNLKVFIKLKMPFKLSFFSKDHILGVSLLGSAILVCAFFYIVAIAYTSRQLLDSKQPRAQRIFEIYKDHPLTQKITLSNDNINTFYIRVDNVDLRNKDKFVFNLKDSENKVIRNLDISGQNLGLGDWVKFKFDPIVDVRGKSFNIELLSEAKDKSTAIVASTDLNNQLAYKVYYQSSYTDAIIKSMGELSQRFFLDLPFAIFYLMLLSALVGIYIIVSKKRWDKV